MGQFDHGAGEVSPVAVGLVAAEQQDVVTVEILEVAQLDLGPAQIGEYTIAHFENWASSPIIDVVVGIEVDENLRGRLRGDGIDSLIHCHSGIDPPLQRDE